MKIIRIIFSVVIPLGEKTLKERLYEICPYHFAAIFVLYSYQLKAGHFSPFWFYGNFYNQTKSKSY